MNDKKMPQPKFPPAASPAAEAVDGKKTRDKVTLAILIGCALVALILIPAMLPSYLFQKNVATADRALNNKQYAQAIPALEKIIKRYPEAWMRWKQMGDAYMGLEPPKPDEALKAYEKAQQLYSGLNINEELGILWSVKGDEKKASEYFTEVIKAKPDSPAANYYLGVQYFNAKQYAEAARSFMAASASPDYDKKAAPYRQKIKDAVLNAPLPTATPTPAQTPAK